MDLLSQSLISDIFVTIILTHQCYNLLITYFLQLPSVLAEAIQFMISIECRPDQSVLKTEF